MCAAARSAPLDDISNSIEFAYAKPLAGVAVQRLDAAAATSAEYRLARGAEGLRRWRRLGFLSAAARPRDGARRSGSGSPRDVAAGRRILFAAWADGELVGTVQLDLATPPNQPHRADVQKLLVMGRARRRGIARG